LRKRIALIVAALLVFGVGAGIAYASIPGPDGVIHGCYKTSNPAQGALIAIDSTASCPSGYAALNWNQTGPQGSPGISGYQAITQTFTRFAGVAANGINTDLFCPSGKKILGGGYDVFNAPQFTVYASRPLLTGPQSANDGWRLTFSHPALQSDVNYDLWAVCATVAS
jgi:hypothetical protein